MVYKLKHRKNNVLGLLIICSSLSVGLPFMVYAEDDGRPVPLKVYIPNITLLPRYFTADKLEYNVDASVITAKGKVIVEQGGSIVQADTLEYDQVKNIVKAKGNVTVLDSNGNVSFADAVELKSDIKESIINNLQVHLADNKEFMAAEERKFQTPVKSKKSFIGRVFAYFSPKPSPSNIANDFSQLEPAAGEAAAAENKVEDKTVIGNEPLIVLPEQQTSSEAKQENSLEKTAIEEKIIKPELPQELPNSATPLLDNQLKQEQKPVVDLQKIVPPVEAKTVEVKKESPIAPLAQKTIKEPVKEPIKNLVIPEPKTVEPKQLAEPSAEPAESLSPKSRDLLKKVSPKIVPKKENPVPKSLDINRTHGMQDLFKDDTASGAGMFQEQLGVKVERKNQRINLDYELERAYDALNSGQSEVAMETYKTILNNAPNNTQALFGLATLYHRARQFDKARSLYGRLLAIDPNHRDGFNNFLVLLADEAPREALTELEKLESKNPGFSTIPAQMAVIYQKLGDQDKATGKMFRAVALAPENLTYRYNLAIMLDKQKNYEEAAKLYRQLIEASQRGEKIPGNIGNIQQRLTFISSNR